MKKNAREMMGLYKNYLSQKKPVDPYDYLTQERILVETEDPSRIGKSGEKEERV